MKIFVLVKPKSKEEKIEKVDDNHFVIKVKEPPVQGRANLAIIRVLADYFNIDNSKIRIISGHTFKNKIIEISP